MKTCNITVAIPTYKRPDELITTLDKILSCEPRPNEIIIHIDGDDRVTAPRLQQYFQRCSQIRDSPDIQIIHSETQVGPGGGRNRAIEQAKNELVASFDDDSYPIDPDYFARLIDLFAAFPKAAVIGAGIYHIGETIEPDAITAAWVAEFIGCGCAYRKSVFQKTTGYVDIPVAYGMEEVDLALRLHELGWGILKSPWLRVFHNTRLTHHQRPQIIAASIANLALLAYLRYPIALWWLGIGQCINRVMWLVRHARLKGISQGIWTIPNLIYRYRQHRQGVSAQSLCSFLQLRRHRTPVSVQGLFGTRSLSDTVSL